ncbi:MAG: efflux RND transporter periplasmic adaptor subunit [Thiohalomonadaceae bacterium]
MKRLAPLLILIPLLAACSKDEPAQASQQRPARPAPAVEVTAVLHQPVGQQIVRVATLRAEREVKLTTEEEGRIERLPYYQGDLVKQGEELLRLNDTLLVAQLNKARAQREQAELDVRRLERLQQSRVVAEDELARARTALQVAQAEEDLLRIRVGNTRIRAPFDGVISARLAEPGDTVGRFAHVLTLTDPRSLLADLSLSELVLPALAVGDSVVLRLDSLSSQSFAGRILRIHPSVNPQTRQGLVEVRIDSPPPVMRPGQLARVSLQLRPLPRTTIPFAALRRDTEGEFVFTMDKNQVLHRVPVVSGIQLGETVEILEGLQADQMVVKGGFLGLAEGMTVRLAGQTASRPEGGERRAP